ncbi:hypothetical protein FJZ33_00050 [Candidatus Poribacteria bacterium]|nr:hypothetical protein [Candidatus Poribacteria bacterium]
MRKKTVIQVNKNPEELNTPNVQVWQDTYMGQVPLDKAKELVRSGRYGVSTNQAIFYIRENKYIQYT